LEDDGNWWIHETSDTVNCDTSLGILDPKQVEHIGDMLAQLKTYGLDEEMVNGAFIPYGVDREMPKEMLRLRETKDNVLNPRNRIFCLPNIVDDRDGQFAEFIDHIIALRVKLLNASLDSTKAIDVEEVDDIIHGEQRKRYISGVRTHVFDEVMAVFDYVPEGYSLDGEIEDDGEEEDVDLEGFDEEEEVTLDIDDGREP
jgi:hypothetical protein